jgi:uncharacterized membrane-anchored protein
LAQLVRSKNAGPYWLTLDVFFATDTAYARAAAALTEAAVADAYRVEPADVRLYHLPDIRVIKASFPRPVVQGSLADRGHARRTTAHSTGGPSRPDHAGVLTMAAVTSPAALRVVSKVPEVTAAFWVTKVLTTGMGETASDFLFRHLAPPIALAIGLVGLGAALVAQFRARRYLPWVYWLAVTMVSVFGTMAADVAHVGLGVPYLASTMFFLGALAVIFAVWYRSERTLSIHSIHTRRRESFYWATVLATFALGTATGDLTAKTWHLGYLPSAVVFAVIIAMPLVAHRWFRLNAIAAFWFAYVVTRPLGASFADWFAAPRNASGLSWGTGPITLVLTVAIIGLVGYLARRRVADRSR